MDKFKCMVKYIDKTNSRDVLGKSNSYVGNQTSKKNMSPLLTPGKLMVYKKTDMVIFVCLGSEPCFHSHNNVNVDFLFNQTLCQNCVERMKARK